MIQARPRVIRRGLSFRLLIAAGLAAMFSVPTVNAQRMDVAQLQTFSRTPFYAGLLNRGLAVLPPAVFHKCPTLRSAGSRITVLSHVTFAQDGYPNSGEWKQRFPVAGCGNDTTLNFYFTATAEEKINTAIGIPGDTLADRTLQRDAQRIAIVAATLRVKSCKTFDTINTTFDGKEAPLSAGPVEQRPILPPWLETWILQGCGQRVAVHLRFVRYATGTHIMQNGDAELR